MRFMAGFAKRMAFVLLLAGVVLEPARMDAEIGTDPGNGGGTQPGPIDLPDHGLNIDVPFTGPVCGFEIIIVSSTAPYNFYTGGRNPWGQPTVTEIAPGQWKLVYSGKCVSPSDSSFTEGGVFKGLHFGFWLVDTSAITFLQESCWLASKTLGQIPCPPITAYGSSWGFITVNNGTGVNVQVSNAEIALSRENIEINRLTRNDLEALSWEPLALEDDFVPAASGDTPGQLWLAIPEHILRGTGYAVLSYDITDPETSEVFSTVTLQIALE